MTRGTPWSRRSLLWRAALLLGSAGSEAVPAVARAAEPAARLLVAGPEGGDLHRRALTLATGLAKVRAGGRVPVMPIGGADGVTGANQFEARFAASPEALLMLPGSALRAWLAGDSRVQFDAGNWVALQCGVSAGVLASRRPVASATPSDPLRVAIADGPGGAAGLLSLDLLGLAAAGVPAPGGAAAALRAGHADAALAVGPSALAMLTAVGATPAFALGMPDQCAPADAADGGLRNLCATFAQAPGAGAALLPAWQAAAAAAQIAYVLVVGSLTPAAAVAAWRIAADRVADAEAADSDPENDDGVRVIGTAETTAVMARVTVDSASLLAFRDWEAKRLHWQPG